jgi:hypothetical protein
LLDLRCEPIVVEGEARLLDVGELPAQPFRVFDAQYAGLVLENSM